VPQPIALLDACVLYSAPLRDLLMYLAVKNVFRARWTDAIHEEWMRNLLSNRSDLRRDQLERTRNLMNTHARDALVTGYEPLIESLTLPDPNDRHVFAAAIHGHAEVIVTLNLEDFPASSLDQHGVEAQHPDQFISKLIESAPDETISAARAHRRSLKNPPKNADEYLNTLESVGLAVTVGRLRSVADQI
jgi:predicted nucleic acid-binding protein